MNSLLMLAFVGVTVTREVPLAPARYVVSAEVCRPDTPCAPTEGQAVYGMGMPNYNTQITVAQPGEPCLYVLQTPIASADPETVNRLGEWRTTPYPQHKGDDQIWGYWISPDKSHRGRTTCEIRQ
jgi:hypothetical protein